jgi:S1-C subfamily serine protease
MALASQLTPALAAPESQRYRDVPESAWYYDSVAFVTDRGYMQDRWNGFFAPNAAFTYDEAAAALSRFNPNFDSSAISGDEAISRARFAEHIHAALGAESLEPINEITDYAIRDVPRDAAYSEAVYALYRAGVATGGDKFGRFFPDRTLTRAEACVMLRRAAEPAFRMYVSLPDKLSAEDIFEICIASAFTIETYDEFGEFIRSGSGFFISPDGLAATCFHVLAGAYSAEITVNGGEKFKVVGVAAYDAETNAAIISAEGDSFDWLPIADSDAVKTGATAYSLGSPLGLDGTISKGVVSYAGREVEGQSMLQFTSNISQGSGGGALLDSAGRVIGITSSSFTAGETLNLAVMSNRITELKIVRIISLAAVTRSVKTAAETAAGG